MGSPARRSPRRSIVSWWISRGSSPGDSSGGEMLLLLVRHAHAGDRDSSKWPDDTQRPLTDKGRKTHAKVSRTLRNLELAPELLLTSPWLRALQTAGIMHDV